MRRLALILALIVAIPLVACSKTEDKAGPVAPATVASGAGSSTSSPPATDSTSGTKPTTGTSVAPTGKVGRGLTGVSTLLAGDGTDSGKGVPGPALSVSLRTSEDIAAAPNGDVFTVDRFGNRLLLVKGGQVTIAFDGNAVKENAFSGIAIDANGKIIFGTNNGINQLNADGTATLLVDRKATAIGTGYSLAFSADGVLYAATDALNVYKIEDGKPTVIAGDGKQSPPATVKGDGGPALEAGFTHIADIAVDKNGVIYVADDTAGRVRAITTDGMINTVAGGGTTRLAETSDLVPEGTAVTSLKLAGPTSLTVDGEGRLYVTDGQSHVIFRLDSKGGLQVVIADVGGVIAQSGKPANQTRVIFAGDLALQGSTLFYVDGQDLHSIANVDK